MGAALFISIYFSAHLRTRGQHIKAAVWMTPERIVKLPQDCACNLNVCGMKGQSSSNATVKGTEINKLFLGTADGRGKFQSTNYAYMHTQKKRFIAISL